MGSTNAKALRYGPCVTRGLHSFTCHPHTGKQVSLQLSCELFTNVLNSTVELLVSESSCVLRNAMYMAYSAESDRLEKSIQLTGSYRIKSDEFFTRIAQH